MKRLIFILALIPIITFGQAGKSPVVTTNTSQTITGQKNFSGTVKIGSDTSMSLGVVSGGIRTGLTINQLVGHPYGQNRVFKSIPLDNYTSSWGLKTGVNDFAPTVDGVDHAINLGYNQDGEITTGQGAAQFGFQLEANYEWDDTSTIYEWFAYYNDYPSPLTSYAIRPFQMGIYRGQSGLWNKRTIALDVDELWVGKTGGTSTSDAFKFYAGQTLGLWKNSLWLQDSSSLCNAANNFGWLYQRDTTGSIVEIARVDNYNNVQLGKDYAEAVRFSAPTLFDSKSAPDRIGNQVALYNDDGVLKAIDGLGNTKVLTGKTIIPQDTIGLDADDLYADPKTAIVKIVLGENLIVNGDFTNWTGTGKSATPDDWTFSDPRDTTKYYVEQNPAGQLHYYADGFSANATLTATSTGVFGEVYRYSFNVVDLSSDSALIYVCGNGFYVTSAGHYSGEFENVDAGGELFSIVAYNTNPRGATDITIDNIKIWKSEGGNLVAPEYDVPTILDSLGVLISGVGSTSTGNPDSLGGQPASAYLLKSDSTIYLTPSDANSAYATKSHTHTEFFDTLAFSFNIPDTVIAGDNAIWKIPNNITIVEVSAFTNTGSVTFNIEERGETTPNTAGTDVMTSDLVADTDQQETTTFSNSTLDKNDWVALVVASKTGDPTLFGVIIYYVKTN